VDQARNVERDVDRSLDLAFSRAHISGLGDRMSLAKLLTISPINRPKTMLLCDMPASRGANTNVPFARKFRGMRGRKSLMFEFPLASPSRIS